MIKPATLWGLFKTCDDDLWLGKICRALGGQEVNLDYGQKQMVKSIMLDSGWMDERVEAQREKWREQKRSKRGCYEKKENAEMSADSALSTAENAETAEMSAVREIPPPSVRPSVPPSVPPSKEIKQESESSPARTREADVSPFVPPCVVVTHDAPTWEDVRRIVIGQRSTNVNPIDEAFAREWFDTAEMSLWRDTRGVDMRPSHVWRRKLQCAWNDELKEQRKANGGKTDGELRREAEREQARQAEESRTDFTESEDD